MMAQSLLAVALVFAFTGHAKTSSASERPVGKTELLELLATEPTSARALILVQQRGIDFALDDSFLGKLQECGAEDSLLTALKSAKVTGSAKATGAADEKQVAAVEHLARAARLNRYNFHPHAPEPELRAAVAADPSDPFVHVALGKILRQTGPPGPAEAEFQTALSLQPDCAEAYLQLGLTMRHRPEEHAGALEYLRKATELTPYDPQARYSYETAQLDGATDKESVQKRGKLAKILTDAGLTMRIRVGGKVEQAKLISKPQPEYPSEAKAAHIQGTVRMEILIGRDGAVKDTQVIEGDPLLTTAAVDAVAQWRYQPTTLNGEPVEVVTEVDVNFRLE